MIFCGECSHLHSPFFPQPARPPSHFVPPLVPPPPHFPLLNYRTSPRSLTHVPGRFLCVSLNQNQLPQDPSNLLTFCTKLRSNRMSAVITYPSKSGSTCDVRDPKRLELGKDPRKLTPEVCWESERIRPDFGWSPSQIPAVSGLSGQI